MSTFGSFPSSPFNVRLKCVVISEVAKNDETPTIRVFKRELFSDFWSVTKLGEDRLSLDPRRSPFTGTRTTASPNFKTRRRSLMLRIDDNVPSPGTDTWIFRDIRIRVRVKVSVSVNI